MKNSKLTIRGENNPFKNCTLTLKLSVFFCFLGIMQVSGSIYFQNTQQNVVSGKITDKNTGELLVGVNIVVEGTTIGTISDVSGKYTIQVPNKNAVLLFSFIGYVSEKVPVNGQSIIDIDLVSDVRALEEVVVGYGTQKKKDITGAISVVATDALKSIPTGNAVIALQGLASGVTILSSGVPGGRTDIFIRGVTSLGNSSPLVIVDGVPGSLENLNVNDINDNNPLAGFTNTSAANYVIGLYTGQFAAQGKDFARKAVRFERKLELAMEGHRFFDLQRYDNGTGYMADLLNAYVAHENNSFDYLILKGATFTKGKNELYPIPQDQIDLSMKDGVPTLTQNPNY